MWEGDNDADRSVAKQGTEVAETIVDCERDALSNHSVPHKSDRVLKGWREE